MRVHACVQPADPPARGVNAVAFCAGTVVQVDVRTKPYITRTVRTYGVAACMADLSS